MHAFHYQKLRIVINYNVSVYIICIYNIVYIYIFCCGLFIHFKHGFFCGLLLTRIVAPR